MNGTSQAVSGYGVVITSRQPVAEIATVFSPNAFKANLTAIDAPQPAQPLCPGANKFLSGMSTISIPP